MSFVLVYELGLRPYVSLLTLRPNHKVFRIPARLKFLNHPLL